MMTDTISNIEIINNFRNYLFNMEKSRATIEKYVRDVERFLGFIDYKNLSKELVISFKNSLIDSRYAISSVNSMIASVNCFLEHINCTDMKVKAIKCQRNVYMPEEKELTKAEYIRLLTAAGKNTRLNLIIQTICSTGIRVSELKYITADAVKIGQATVLCKGKNRVILIPCQLKKLLSNYIRKSKIKAGPIFVSKNGVPLDRCYIWKAMKKLCKKSGVEANKIFPHNLRKLFARTFYAQAGDISKLADVLGHSSISTTRIYIMTTGKEHRQKIEQLGLII